MVVAAGERVPTDGIVRDGTSVRLSDAPPASAPR